MPKTNIRFSDKPCYDGDFTYPEKSTRFTITKSDDDTWLQIKKSYECLTGYAVITYYIESTWFKSQLIAYCSGLPLITTAGLSTYLEPGEAAMSISASFCGSDLFMGNMKPKPWAKPWGVFIDRIHGKQILEAL